MDVAVDDWREGLITDLLRPLRLRGSRSFRPEYSAPWSFSHPVEEWGVFHLVVRGHCWLQSNALTGPLQLSAGDLVIVLRGGDHVLADAPGRSPRNFFDLVERNPPDAARRLRVAGDGDLTELLCGGWEFEDHATDPLLAALPPVIHIHGDNGLPARSLQATVTHLVDELDSNRPGAEGVVTRLADIMFIQAVRAYFEENADSTATGWFAALRDRQIGRALALLHRQPDQPWTVALLAHRVGASRSAFASRFTSLVGEPPVQYLTRVRLHTACRRLRGHEKLSVIARSAAYESMSAFCKAFKRQVGLTPGEYRRLYRSQGSDAQHSGTPSAGEGKIA